MEEYSSPFVEKTIKKKFILPPHRNKMVFAILATLFCCLLTGIISIVYSSKSNGLYEDAMFTDDSDLKRTLYMQSEQQNKNANTWLIISLIIGVITWISYFITGSAYNWL